MMHHVSTFFFFFNDTATTEIYTLSLHDRSSDLPSRWDIFLDLEVWRAIGRGVTATLQMAAVGAVLAVIIGIDRKSTRLNSSHANISYAVFFLKKKKKSMSHKRKVDRILMREAHG